MNKTTLFLIVAVAIIANILFFGAFYISGRLSGWEIVGLVVFCFVLLVARTLAEEGAKKLREWLKKAFVRWRSR